MKKFFVIFSLIAIVFACNSNDTSTPGKETEEPKDPEAEKGLALVVKNHCFQCHQVSEKYQGPSYEAIAERYKGNSGVVDTLAQRIIVGSTGIWGTIPMIKHPNISQDDARLMVKYVLSLKK